MFSSESRALLTWLMVRSKVEIEFVIDMMEESYSRKTNRNNTCVQYGFMNTAPIVLSYTLFSISTDSSSQGYVLRIRYVYLS
jgi:hypothetical protein